MQFLEPLGPRTIVRLEDKTHILTFMNKSLTPKRQNGYLLSIVRRVELRPERSANSALDSPAHRPIATADGLQQTRDSNSARSNSGEPQ